MPAGRWVFTPLVAWCGGGVRRGGGAGEPPGVAAGWRRAWGSLASVWRGFAGWGGAKWLGGSQSGLAGLSGAYRAWYTYGGVTPTYGIPPYRVPPLLGGRSYRGYGQTVPVTIRGDRHRENDLPDLCPYQSARFLVEKLL